MDHTEGGAPNSPHEPTNSIGLDLTKDEHRNLRVAAALADMSMAAYCRKVVSEAAEKVMPKAGKGGAK